MQSATPGAECPTPRPSAFTSPVRLGQQPLDEELDRLFEQMWVQDARERDERFVQ